MSLNYIIIINNNKNKIIIYLFLSLFKQDDSNWGQIGEAPDLY